MPRHEGEVTIAEAAGRIGVTPATVRTLMRALAVTPRRVVEMGYEVIEEADVDRLQKEWERRSKAHAARTKEYAP